MQPNQDSPISPITIHAIDKYIFAHRSQAMQSKHFFARCSHVVLSSLTVIKQSDEVLQPND